MVGPPEPADGNQAEAAAFSQAAATAERAAATAAGPQAARLALDAGDGVKGGGAMVHPEDVSNLIALTVLIALAAAILLLGNVALELVELPPALSGAP